MNYFPDNKEEMIGYIEAFQGMGLISGPLIGSLLYSIGGYKFIFFTMGILFVSSSLFIKTIFGPEIDTDNNQNVDNDYTNANSGVQTSENMLFDSGIQKEEAKQNKEDEVYIGTFELLKYP